MLSLLINERIDSYMDYGDTGNSNSKQSTFNTQNNNKKKQHGKK